jgi:hypothetical protein
LGMKKHKAITQTDAEAKLKRSYDTLYVCTK